MCAAHLVLVVGTLNTWSVDGHQEHRHATVGTPGDRRRSEHHGEVGDRCIVNEDLLAVENPVAAVAVRIGLQAAQIRAGIGLGQGIVVALRASEQPGEIACLLLAGPMLDQQRTHELDEPALIGNAGIAIGQLFHHGHVVGHATTDATVFFRHGDAEVAPSSPSCA